AEVTLIDLRDFPMPLFDGDLERDQGMPEHGARLKKLMSEHDGFLLACPEYNSSITAVMKNAIDWASRPNPKEAFHGKTALLLSASPGGLGGLRGLVTVRSILGNIGVLVLPEQLAVNKATEAFDESGGLKDAAQLATIDRLVHRLVEVTGKLVGS
ncbi:MAG: NADPH-dependent FMN reductase, partial [Gemmataceae bacterium]